MLGKLKTQKTSSVEFNRVYDDVVASQWDDIRERVRRLCRDKVTSTESDDMVQEVFLRFWLALTGLRFGNLRPELDDLEQARQVLRKWLFVTARFVVLEFLHGSRRRRLLRQRVSRVEEGRSVEPAMIEVRDAICQCPECEQDVLVLLLQGWRIEEMAAHLHIGRSTVIRRIVTAKARMRRLLG